MIRKALILINLILLSSSAALANTIENSIGEILTKGPAQHIGAKGHGYSSKEIDEILTEFYQQRQLKPVWISKGKPTERAEVLISFLEASSAEGLNPSDYRVELIRKFMKEGGAAGLAKLDILLTIELAHYAGDDDPRLESLDVVITKSPPGERVYGGAA